MRLLEKFNLGQKTFLWRKRKNTGRRKSPSPVEFEPTTSRFVGRRSDRWVTTYNLCPFVLTLAASSKNQIQLLIRILSDAINLVILMFKFWLFLGNPCWLRELLLESFCLILVNLELWMFWELATRLVSGQKSMNSCFEVKYDWAYKCFVKNLSFC